MSRENVEIVRRWWALFNDDTLPIALCDEQIEIINPDEFPLTGPYYGHQGVRQWASDAWDIIDEIRVEPVEVFEVPDSHAAVAVLENSGRMRHAGIPAKVRWAAVVTIRDGKLVRAQGFMTKDQALEAAGLSK
jgi:ketosteroid isomerase-like protein